MNNIEGNYNNLFNYKIIFSGKRKMTIAFKVIDNVLNIISPKKVPLDFLISLIEKRKNWTIERINRKKDQRNFIQDNKILFLGNEVELKIQENKLLKNGGYCDFINNKLIVNISKNWDENLLKNILVNWYKQECEKIMNDRVLFFANKYNLNYGKINIKEQKSVWGTCNAKNDLTFNWKIMFFKKDVIDYLVVHELVHTIHKNHSVKYWKKVESILPNYKELNEDLKKLNIKVI